VKNRPLMARALFVCLHNAGRSQMSEALFRRVGEGRREARSAVVTMGCGDECPYIPGKRYVDWDLKDPRGQAVEAVRATRDEIDRRVRARAGVSPIPPSCRCQPRCSRRVPLAAESAAGGQWRRVVV
jgi:protein-tyrosine-phosphatase